MEIGTVIRKYRTSKELTQEWVADSIGISNVAYQNYELGKARLIHPNYFKICKILDINPCQPLREILDELPEAIIEPTYLTERISNLEKRNEALIAENAVLKYKLSSYEEPGSGSSRKKAV